MSEPSLRLYNTLTRSKEAFRPIDPAHVRMYVCGPTVYDFAHIGNARPAIVFDVLFRLLRHVYGESHVTYVRNITDVDDKINARALRDFPDLPLNEAIRRVTEATNAQYQKDVAALGCLPPTHQPRATEFVEPRADGKADMITLIQRLIERGHAYEAGGEVLFDIASMKDYGQLSKRPLDEQIAGARVEVDRHKKNPGDFVLWKLSAPDEPGWEAPWGREAWTAAGGTGKPKGRPGWHIECSAMSAAYLGDVFDIHGGGLDLIFPHHENEIAQSRCAHGTQVMANTWMHNGFVQVEGRKMSKSEGNFVTIADLLAQWEGETIRLAMLSAHYRQPIDFTSDRLSQFDRKLDDWYRAVPDRVDAVPPDQEFVDLLSDDLNLWPAISYLDQLLADRLRLGQRHDDDSIRKAREASARLKANANLIGLLQLPYESWNASRLAKQTAFQLSWDETFNDHINRSIEQRLAFIAAKNWAEADRIRDELLSQGIQLKDGKDPVTGERVTTWEVKR